MDLGGIGAEDKLRAVGVLMSSSPLFEGRVLVLLAWRFHILLAITVPIRSPLAFRAILRLKYVNLGRRYVQILLVEIELLVLHLHIMPTSIDPGTPLPSITLPSCHSELVVGDFLFASTAPGDPLELRPGLQHCNDYAMENSKMAETSHIILPPSII